MPRFVRFVTYAFIVLNQTADKKKEEETDLEGTQNGQEFWGGVRKGAPASSTVSTHFWTICATHPDLKMGGAGIYGKP